MTLLPAIILAGGQATRMGGGDKALLPLGDGTILDQILMRLTPQARDIALNANGDAARFSAYDLPVVADSIPDFAGPLAGVLAGLDWAAQLGAHSVISVAGDTPFFPLDLVDRMQQATLGMAHPLALAISPSGRHPTFGIWPVALRDDLRHALENGLRKVVLWTDQHQGRMVPFDDDNAFFNVNTPEDLAKAVSLQEQMT